MNKINLILIIILTTSCSNKEIITYYNFKPDQIKERYFVKSLNNKKVGEFISYDIDGNILSISNFNNDKLNGISNIFCEKDSIVLESFQYKNDKLNGETKGFYCDGSPRYSALYKEDKLVKVYDLYSKDGKSLFPGNHNNGTGEVLKYNEKGVLVAKYEIKDGLKDGIYISISNTGYRDTIFYTKGYSERLGFSSNLY